MTTCNEKAETLFSIFAPEPMPAEAIADAFAQFPEDRRPLAAYIFTNLVRLGVIPVAIETEDAKNTLAVRQLEACRKVAEDLASDAEKAELPALEAAQFKAHMQAFVAAANQQELEKIIPAVTVLLSLIGLVENSWQAETMQLLELLADRQDREGCRAVMCASILKDIISFETIPIEKYQSVGQAMAAKFRKVLSDEETRRFVHLSDLLRWLNSKKSLTRFIPANSRGGLSERDVLYYVLFVGDYCRASLPEELFEEERFARDVHNDIDFFLDTSAADAFLLKICEFVTTVTAPERDLWLQAFLIEAAAIQTVLRLPEEEFELCVGKSGEQDTIEDTAILNSFVRLGLMIAGCDDLTEYLSRPKTSLN